MHQTSLNFGQAQVHNMGGHGIAQLLSHDIILWPRHFRKASDGKHLELSLLMQAFANAILVIVMTTTNKQTGAHNHSTHTSTQLQKSAEAHPRTPAHTWEQDTNTDIKNTERYTTMNAHAHYIKRTRKSHITPVRVIKQLTFSFFQGQSICLKSCLCWPIEENHTSSSKQWRIIEE